MAKLTSQNSTKSKTAKSKNANDKAAAEGKKPKSLSRKTGASNKKVPPAESKDKLPPEPSPDLHISVVSMNGHSELGSKLSPLDSAFDLQERVRDMVKLAKEQGYVTYDDINEALPENMADPEEMEQLINRLRSMEVDIIDASEVDRYKDGKKDIDDEEEEKDQKLDILDDPVRMYLKQMGQVPLLTREQEVEISKRIEEAEAMVQKNIHRFGFIAGAHLELAQKLTEGRERFDRVILDKKIESRERYMKMLPRLCKQVEQLSNSIGQQYGQVGRVAAKKETKRLKTFEKAVASLQRLYPKFYFKQKVTEEFVHLADEQFRALLHLQTELGKRPRPRPGAASIPAKIRDLEKGWWL